MQTSIFQEIVTSSNKIKRKGDHADPLTEQKVLEDETVVLKDNGHNVVEAHQQ